MQTDRCNLFPDAHVLRKFRKLKQKLKRPHFRQGTQYQQVFLFEKKMTLVKHALFTFGTLRRYCIKVMYHTKGLFMRILALFLTFKFRLAPALEH